MFHLFCIPHFEDDVDVEEDDDVEVSSLHFTPDCSFGVVIIDEVLDSFLPFLNNKSKIIRNVPYLNI